MSEHPPRDLVTPRRAARILGVHLATVYRWVLADPPKLRAWRLPTGRLRVSRREVRALLAPVAPPARPATKGEVRQRPSPRPESLQLLEAEGLRVGGS